MNQNRSKYYRYCISNSQHDLDIIKFKQSNAASVQDKQYFAAQIRETLENIDYFEHQLAYEVRLQQFIQEFGLVYPHLQFINIENSTQDTSNSEDSF